MKKHKFNWERIGAGYMLCHRTIFAEIVNVTNVIWNRKPCWKINTSLSKVIIHEKSLNAAKLKVESLISQND